MVKNSRSIFEAILIFLVTSIYCSKGISQCTDQITHTSGSLMVGCVNTTVTSSGVVDINTAYCAVTTPYFIGYNWSTSLSGNGSYTFNFAPAVSAVTLNFSGISNTPPHTEEILLKVNGVHYSIPMAGNPNGCDPFAVLTMAGNVGGCLGCSVSGWIGTTVPGPISTLEVKDTVLSGAPAGSLFSLFICGGSSGMAVNLGNDTVLCTGNTLMLDATTVNSAYLWQDNSTNPTFVVSQQGTYWVQVTNSCGTTTDTITVNYVPPPTVALGNDTTLCPGDALILNAAYPSATYLWQDNSTNPAFNVTQAGTYWVIVSVGSCSYADSITVNYWAPVLIELGNDTAICDGASLLLDATTAGATYMWQDNSTNPTYLVTQAGNYHVVAIVNGCSGQDSITVSTIPIPVIDLGNDTMICTGSTLLLDATIANGVYLWQDNSTNAAYLVSQAGNYEVTVSVDGCSSHDSINVGFIPLPPVDLGHDTTFCAGSILLLDATTANATYLWQNNSTGATFTVSQSGIYWVEVTVNGCTGTDSIAVAVAPLPNVNLGNDTSICEGNSITLNAMNPGSLYFWQDSSSSMTLTVYQEGLYWVSVYNGACTLTDSIYVGIRPRPSFDLGNDTAICESSIFFLDATYPGASYLWNDGSTGAGYGVTNEGLYHVIVSANGCSRADSISVTYADCNEVLYIPNIFSPNGDGINDVLYARGDGIFQIRLIIWDRWGERIFDTEEQSRGWDGTFRGKACDDGVYTYAANATFMDQTRVKKMGTITLVR